MDTLRLKNYRCFDDTGVIELKPLTFLLGSNSSGKSSFLKFFPLLKQSVGIKRNGFFLWLSNNVDFKDFSNTVKDGKGNIEIEFTIRNFSVSPWPKNNGTDMNVAFIVTCDESKTEYLKCVSLTFGDQKIQIETKGKNKWSEAKIHINDWIVPTDKERIFIYNTIELIPRLGFANNEKVNVYNSIWCEEQLNELLGNRPKLGILAYRAIFHNTFIGSIDNAVDYIRKRLEKTAQINGNKIDWEKINNLYLLYHINDIIDAINENISRLSARTSYIRPLRATTERYYRFQNYAVDEINSDGNNLAMYLYNLTENEMIRFQEWTQNLFKFRVHLRPSEGHVEILIEEDGRPPRNMVDVGFGYTQILPTIAIIWKSLYMDFDLSNNKYGVDKDEHLVVIEQPELHLHPRLQGLFAQMLANIIMESHKSNRDLRIIIETHSEVILNKIGELIERKMLDGEKVNVLLFNAVNEGMEKYIESALFTDDGYLTNWPLGFLSDDVY